MLSNLSRIANNLLISQLNFRTNSQSNSQPPSQSSPQPLAKTIKSVLAAFIGVQSNKNREDDFTHGKFSHFVLIGIIGVILFIIALIAIVNLVLS